MPPKDENVGLEHASTPVGQYYLLDKIAQGGMAEIFKGLAYDLHGIKRTVVIKKILPQIAADPEFINMLVNEAKIAVMLSHGNIAQIYDLGKVGDDYFMVMEYVDGKSISQIHKRNLKMGDLIPVENVCYFISEVAQGLDYMHKRSDEQGRNLGIIHRDISPQNVIVSYSGTVKIIDFGIAKAAIQIDITESGVLKGKFAYMSPEQACGETMDQRSDIFSLGVILFELLTGKRLFKGKNKKETLANVRRSSVSAPSEFRADLPKELDRIVLRALAKDPKDRYTWASEMHDDLVKFLYTHYPEFKHSSITEYIRELFKKEINEREVTEEEAKTPYLIIDHTQSAILPENMEVTGRTKIPPQLKEFMLDEETPVGKFEEVEEDEEEPKERKGVIERIKNNWKSITSLFFGGIAVLVMILAIGINRGWFSAPAFLSVFAPATKLIVYVDPPDADVYFGGKKLDGRSKYKLKDIKPGTNYRLIVEKKGYEAYFHSVSLEKGETRKLKVNLQSEAPHFASLEITSEPPGATIFLNEDDTNLRTPATLTKLKPETFHTIGLFLDNYKFWGRDVSLKPDEEKKISAELLMNYGALEIISSPEGATIEIDGKMVGKTPFKKEELGPGKVFEISVSKKGFKPWSSKAKIKAGSTTVLRPKLDRTKENLIPQFLRDLDKPLPKPEPTDEMLAPAP